MKKQISMVTTGLLVLAGTLLFGNAVGWSTFLNKMVSTEKISYPESEIPPPILLSHTTATKGSDVLTSVPKLKFELTATIPTSEEYLTKDMTQEELQIIYNYIDHAKEGADATRQETNDELNRRRVLWDKYDYDGLRPQNKLPLAKGNYDYYFDLETQTYYLPDRALTDEELLQFIDRASRINYAYKMRNKTLLPQPSAKDITEDEAIAKAKDSITKLFNVQLSDLRVISNFSENYPTNSGQWSIMFSPYKAETLLANGETYWQYWADIDSLTGNIENTHKWCSTYEEPTINENEVKLIQNDNSWIEKAKNILTEQLGETRKIKDAIIQFKSVGGTVLDENGNIVEGKILDRKTRSVIDDVSTTKRGIVPVLITLDDGSAYMVTLLYPDQSLSNVAYTPDILKKNMLYFY